MSERDQSPLSNMASKKGRGKQRPVGGDKRPRPNDGEKSPAKSKPLQVGGEEKPDGGMVPPVKNDNVIEVIDNSDQETDVEEEQTDGGEEQSDGGDEEFDEEEGDGEGEEEGDGDEDVEDDEINGEEEESDMGDEESDNGEPDSLENANGQNDTSDNAKEQQYDYVYLRLISDIHPDEGFLVKATEPMRNMKQLHNSQLNETQKKTLKQYFLYNGNLINDDDTPQSLGLKETDDIHVFHTMGEALRVQTIETGEVRRLQL